jgi:plasmid stabilization system protein ParE
MRVKLSKNAANYVRQEAAYFRQYSKARAEHFLERVKTVRRDLAAFAASGFGGDDLLIPGTRRFIRDGYYFDYRIKNDHIEIADISSSVNTPLLDPSDTEDGDYEVERNPPGSKGPGG